ncbi:MAG: glycoside hydrolase family 43 protein [Tannerella sp.]|jgi:beta-xylosidase|nr:glycoside hydrolase family 43 protein [Tannerella sp.]
MQTEKSKPAVVTGLYPSLWRCFFLLFCLAASCRNDKPTSFRPGEIWPDNHGVHINAHGGGLLLQDGVYYWYGEHKTEGEGGNRANVGFHCYSSTDLYNWKDEGIALSVMPEGSGSDIEKGAIMERPKVIRNTKTGKYVMWFHLEPKGAGYTGARSGVAVADSPKGPFTFLRSVRPDAGHWPANYPEDLRESPTRAEGQRFSGGNLPMHPDSLNLVKRDFEGGQMARDMTLFVDDDGKAYHIFASEENSTLHISLLTDDYLDHSGTYYRFFEGRFMEAPAMFKNGDDYYLIMSGCTGWAPNAGRAAVAPSVFGPWEELQNPFTGREAEVSFRSQSTYVVQAPGQKNQFIYMGDRWQPENAIDGRYIWLPIRFDGKQPVIEWRDEWSCREHLPE